MLSLIWFWFWFSAVYLNDFEVTTKTQLFLTIAVKSDNSSIREIEEASTNFWQTLMWWFSNPALLSQIMSEINPRWVSISAYKQERQNMIVEIVSPTKKMNDLLIKSAYYILNEKIKEYNSRSNVKYMTFDQGRVTSFSPIKNVTIPIAWLVLWFLISIILILLYENMTWSVSNLEQIEEILWNAALDIINPNWSKNDYTLISVAMLKMKPIVILAGVNISTDILAVSIAQRQSFFWEQLALVDGDLQKRILQHTLWLSLRLKNLKWYTDIQNNIDYISKEKLWFWEKPRDLIFLQNTLDENLKFVPAWTWNKFLTQIFTNISERMKTLIHTQLPENVEVLRLSKASLVLVIKLWRTKVSELKRIKEVWDDEIRYIVVK